MRDSQTLRHSDSHVMHFISAGHHRQFLPGEGAGLPAIGVRPLQILSPNFPSPHLRGSLSGGHGQCLQTPGVVSDGFLWAKSHLKFLLGLEDLEGVTIKIFGQRRFLLKFLVKDLHSFVQLQCAVARSFDQFIVYEMQRVVDVRGPGLDLATRSSDQSHQGSDAHRVQAAGSVQS